MSKKKKLTYAQKACLSRLGRLCYTSQMFQDGSRVGLAVSGGVDSLVLCQSMLLYKKKLPFRIELLVLHINPGFSSASHLPLQRWVEEKGVAAWLEVKDFGPRAHSPENKKNSPCFFCSWRRRKRLFQLVKRFGLTHLALGHTADDLLATFFMNAFYAGRIEGMYPRESFFGNEFEVVRPLLFVEKRIIKRAAADWGLPVVRNPCPSAKNTKRSETWQVLENLISQDKRIRKSLYSALFRWQGEHLIPKGDLGHKKS